MLVCNTICITLNNNEGNNSSPCGWAGASSFHRFFRVYGSFVLKIVIHLWWIYVLGRTRKNCLVFLWMNTQEVAYYAFIIYSTIFHSFTLLFLTSSLCTSSWLELLEELDMKIMCSNLRHWGRRAVSTIVGLSNSNTIPLKYEQKVHQRN